MLYVVITPARNEEKLIQNTLNSVCNQTLKPIEWIIVDDGSTDDTSAIVKNYCNQHPWIRLVYKETINEARSGGSKVVRAFYKGYENVIRTDYNFIVKLDADLTLPNDYFERVAMYFKEHPKVGICGGYCSNISDSGEVVREHTSPYHVRGAFKAYRKACFNDIGGLKPVWDWDGLDQMTAMYTGWDVKVLPLEVIHHRTTSKEYNLIPHNYRSGIEYYKMGYDVFLLILKSVFLLNKKPYLLGSFAFFTGFIAAYLKNLEKIVDPDLAKFIRMFQYKRILNVFRSK